MLVRSDGISTQYIVAMAATRKKKHGRDVRDVRSRRLGNWAIDSPIRKAAQVKRI